MPEIVKGDGLKVADQPKTAVPTVVSFDEFLAAWFNHELTDILTVGSYVIAQRTVIATECAEVEADAVAKIAATSKQSVTRTKSVIVLDTTTIKF